MKIKDVNQSIGKAFFQIDNGQEEKDLILESFDRLIKKQERITEKEGNDITEVEKLSRYKKSKDKMEKVKAVKKQEGEEPAEQKPNIISRRVSTVNKIDRGEEMFEVGKDNATEEVSHRNMYDLVNALNNHIVELEEDGTWNNENQEKYGKLKSMLYDAQNQKAAFETTREKPKHWGRLRK